MSKFRLVSALLQQHGHLDSEVLGIDLASGDPDAAARWLRTVSRPGGGAEVTSLTTGRVLESLRAEAGNDPEKERALLMERFGLDERAVDVFFREMQLGWDELWPFADRAALDAARRLEIGESAEELALLVDPDDYVRLVTGLVRAGEAARRELEESLRAA